MTPASAATGMLLMRKYTPTVMMSSETPAKNPETRSRAPLATFIIAWPIVAQPPMPPSTPHTKLASPWPRHSRFGLPLVCVSSSTNPSVMSDSIRPTMAMTVAYGTTFPNVDAEKLGIAYLFCIHTGTGNGPLTSAKSMTSCVL